MHTIVIDGVIGWEIDGRYIREELEKAEGQDVRVEIASPGGSVYSGIEIFNLFRNYPGKVHMHIMGLAASMASYIPLAGDHITAEDNTVFFIHNVWGWAGGDYREMEKAADVFKNLSKLLARAYAKKTGKPMEEIENMMDDETYFYGEEMKEAGFVDEIIETEKEETKEEAIAFAKLQIEDCHGQTKEMSEKEEDIQKVAALLIPGNRKLEKQSDNNKSTPAGAGNNKKEGSKKMALEQLKSENPDLYSSAIQAGISQERKRVLAHVKAGKRSGAMDSAHKFIEEGKSFLDEDVQAEYLTAGMNKKDLEARAGDDPGNTTTPENPDESKEDEIMAQVESSMGISGGEKNE